MNIGQYPTGKSVGDSGKAAAPATFGAGDYVASANGSYFAILQKQDKDPPFASALVLVMAMNKPVPANSTVTGSGICGAGGPMDGKWPATMNLTADGNLEILNADKTVNWSSNTNSATAIGASLTLSDNGVLQIERVDKTVVWQIND